MVFLKLEIHRTSCVYLHRKLNRVLIAVNKQHVSHFMARKKSLTKTPFTVIIYDCQAFNGAGEHKFFFFATIIKNRTEEETSL